MEPTGSEGSFLPYWEDIMNEGGLNIDVDLETPPRSDSASSFVGSPPPTAIIKHVSDPVVSELQRRQFNQHVRAAQPSSLPKLDGPGRLERRHTDPGFKKPEVDRKMFECFQLIKDPESPAEDRESKMPKAHKLKPSVGRSSTPGYQDGDAFISLDPLAGLQNKKPTAPLHRPIPRQIIFDVPPHVNAILRLGQVYYLNPDYITQLVDAFKVTPFDAPQFNEVDHKRFSYIHSLTIDPDGRPCNNIRAVIQSDLEKKALIPKQVVAILTHHLDSLFFLNPQEKQQIAECFKPPFEETLVVRLYNCLMSWARNDRLTQALALTSFLSHFHANSDFLTLQRCEFSMWKGFYEEVIKLANGILKRVPNQQYALVLKAYCLLIRNDPDGAADVMIAYSKVHPQCFYTKTLLVMITSFLDEKKQVVESLDKLISENPEYLFAIMLRAELHYRSHRWDSAKRDYTRIFTLCPKFEYVRGRLEFIETTHGSRKLKRELWK